MNDAIEQFRLAIAGAGVPPPDDINADGKIHRFSTNGRRGDDSGWYCLHLEDLSAGAFGCWRSGLHSSWCAKPDKAMTQPERHAYAQRYGAMRAQQEAAKAQAQAKASEAAAALWAQGDPHTAGAHPYLRAKGVRACGVKVFGDALLIPMRDTAGKLHSLQTIREGDKRFHPGGRVKGCYHALGQPRGRHARLIVCEGYATGASIHEATCEAVAVAFNAGNLQAVASALRTKCRDMQIVIAADDDHLTHGNPGLTHTKAAALAVGGLVVAPQFPADRAAKATDFNDLHALRGLEAVRCCFSEAWEFVC